LSYTRAQEIVAWSSGPPPTIPWVDERLIRFRPRAVLVIVGVVLATAAIIELLLLARGVVVWILIAAFLATALNPAVEWVLARGIVARRGLAVGIVFITTLLLIVAIGATIVPSIVNEINDFAKAVPGYVEDITKGRGRLGFLERDYQIVEKIREAINKSGVSGILGLSDAAISVTRSIVSIVVATITIAFLTFFMLLEGPTWVERFFSLLPEERQPRARKIGRDIYRTVGGYVAGNLAISVIAGVSTSVVLLALGVPYAFALGVVVGLLDLVPLAGATIAAVIVGTVAMLDSTTAGIVVIAFFIVYQQLENHVIQPLVYGRTVKLSPLAVLVAVLIGAELAGVIGALGAIPIAGAIQVILIDWLEVRRARTGAPVAAMQEGQAEA
jgi:predicted PurR-regulated permease PerM